MSSNVLDAIALVSARNNYQTRARELQAEAKALKESGYPLTGRVCEYKAKIAQRAALAELINPEPR